MIEDDIYRASTQYRYWSYTREALAALRQKTNEVAAERVRVAFANRRRDEEKETKRTENSKKAIEDAEGENGTTNGVKTEKEEKRDEGKEQGGNKDQAKEEQQQQQQQQQTAPNTEEETNRDDDNFKAQSAEGLETLTVDEELKIVRWGCEKIIETGRIMHPPIPMEIRVCQDQQPFSPSTSYRRFLMSCVPASRVP